MKASDRVLAGRYAAALFAAAAARAEEGRVQTDLDAARRALLGDDAILRHPRVAPVEKKRLVRAAVKDRVGALTLSFLELLVDKKRLELLPLAAADYARLAADKGGVARAAVRTARPLDAGARRALTERLQAFSGKTIELDIKEDPELIGGLSVKLGDWVLDSSLRGQLRRMRESIHHGH
ncbi:MAG: ATP synthase F1 subunit delta [Elusimicrobia bacterium]|nr:ATP synthase F1 subunit delta [Elusimicrobiota bacterium]